MSAADGQAPEPLLIGHHCSVHRTAWAASLRAGDAEGALSAIDADRSCGADLIDVCCAGADDEPALLERLLPRLAAREGMPVLLDSRDPAVWERWAQPAPAIRVKGRSLPRWWINSVHLADPSALERGAAVAARTHAGVVALALPAAGVPTSAAARLDAAAEVLHRLTHAGVAP